MTACLGLYGAPILAISSERHASILLASQAQDTAIAPKGRCDGLQGA